uniref:MFS transporter n=1 Tax=Streptomyces sp. NBC_00003 TaxID=2903608 RepID=A0AAU2VE37_9ACTN
MHTTTAAPRSTRVWLTAGLILLAVNLRAAITAVPPVLPDLTRALHLTPTGISILTTLPVLCLGLFSPLAPRLTRRLGETGAITCALAAIGTGCVLRAAVMPVCLYGGTVLASAGIALGNVLVIAAVKQHYPDRLGMMNGLIMMVMALSGAVAAGTAVPLTTAAGWQGTLMLWGAPALAGILLWSYGFFAAPPSRSFAPIRPQQTGSLTGSRTAWAVIVFLGLICLAFYTLVTWLPAIMTADGYSSATAGTMVSVMLTLGIPLGLALPLAATRMHHQGPLVAVMVAAKVIGLTGILLVPAAGWIWILVLGIATGGSFPLAMTVLALRAPDAATAAKLSSLAQTGAYLLAGIGPFAIGSLHTLTGGWSTSLTVLLLLAVPELLAGLYAARPRFVTTRRPGRHRQRPPARIPPSPRSTAPVLEPKPSPLGRG